jgi:nucleoid-associated protein EbfC
MFKGLGALGNIASLMRNAGELSGKLNQVTENLRQRKVQGESGGGMVRVEANGLGVVTTITIEPELIASGDGEMLQDLLPAAINQAMAKARQLHVEAMRDVTGGISLPGMDQLMEQYMSHGGDQGSQR